MVLEKKVTHLLYGIVILFCLAPFVSPAIALIIGLSFSLLGIKNKGFSKHSSLTLQASIVLMGFGMNLTQVISTSRTGFMLTATTVVLTLTMGLLIGKLLKVDSKTSILISSGTAICGGSAIAAIAPVINAEDYQISFSLIVIFTLNAVALFIFPFIGHFLHLNQEIFGYWSAIAIHDTSSVVGAAASYGQKALEIATIVKLTRALWIIPLSIAIALFNKDSKNNKIKIPWFIGLFVISIITTHLIPQWQTAFTQLNWLGKKGMVIALFFIGSNMSIAETKKAGGRSFLHGVLLWFFIGISTLVILAAKL